MIKRGMPRDIQISASMMCADWSDAGSQVKALESLDVSYLHWDIIDGRFAPDFTMGSCIVNSIRSRTHLSGDYHLMVEEPRYIFDSFSFKPGDIVTVHQEASRNLHRDLVALRRLGVSVGVAMCPATPLNTLDYIIEDVDVILIMTVNPGFMGQALVPQTLRKVQELRQRIDSSDLDIKITLDGNVSYDNIPDMVVSGADILVGGSSGLFRSDRPLPEAYEEMQRYIKEGMSRDG